jgi:hypothetical protein
MPKYIMRVVTEYPVSAVNVHDALRTIPLAIQFKIPVKAKASIINTETKKVDLKAALVGRKNHGHNGAG